MGLFAWLRGTKDKQPGPIVLSVHEAFERSKAGSITILDVREPSEWAETGRPQGSRGVPLRRRDFEMAVLKEFGGNQSEPIALICRSGARASDAVRRLSKVGFDELFVIAGGFVAWKKADLPVDWRPF